MSVETPDLSVWRRGGVAFLTLLIALWGLMGLYSVTSLNGHPGTLLLRQCGWLGAGCALMLIASQLPYGIFRRMTGYGTAAAWAALAGVLLWGKVHNGMRGWYEFAGITLQPSELVKPFFCLLAARIAASGRTELRRAALLGICSAGYLVLILLEPDFGTAAVYAATALLTLWLGNFRWYYPLGAALLTAGAMTGAAWRHPYVLVRFSAYLHPGLDPGGAGWHLQQFEFCFARGGWFGVKQAQAAWSNGFLPLAHNDSMFAATGEVLGGFGLLLLLLLLLLWIAQMMRLGTHAPTPERRLFIDLASGMIALQALLHVYVNLGLLPPTGITLPLVSYGGSSLLGTMLAAGMVLSASRPEPPPQEQRG